jgi:hemoglobin
MHACNLTLTIKSVLTASCLALLLSLSACSSTKSTLYQEVGGQAKVTEITDNLIEEIGFSPRVIPYFENTNIDRFRTKLNEHLCVIADGPCAYSGDSMLLVHTGMDINEHDFNVMVELLISAMTKAGLSHTTQNKILARLVPMREDIIYH